MFRWTCLFSVPRACAAARTICPYLGMPVLWISAWWLSVSAVKWVYVYEREWVREMCIFRLASMRWDSTLQGLAACQTPLLPRKHTAAWLSREVTQLNCFWPFFLWLGKALCCPHYRYYTAVRMGMEFTQTHTDICRCTHPLVYNDMHSYTLRHMHLLSI